MDFEETKYHNESLYILIQDLVTNDELKEWEEIWVQEGCPTVKFITYLKRILEFE